MGVTSKVAKSNRSREGERSRTETEDGTRRPTMSLRVGKEGEMIQPLPSQRVKILQKVSFKFINVLYITGPTTLLIENITDVTLDVRYY